MNENLKSIEPTGLPTSIGYGPNTGLFKVTQFNGNAAAYDAWKTRMEIQIKVLGLTLLTDNSQLIEDIKDFETLDEKFYDLMVCSVSDSVLGTLKSCGKSGSAMWHRLESEFNRKDVASKYSVLAQLLSYRYHGNGIQTHCDDVIALINTLIAKGVNFDSDLGVCILLFSLPAEFSTFVTTISAQVGVTLTVDIVRTRVIAEEMRLRRTGSDAVLFSKSKHQNRNFTGGPKKGGLEKRKGKCFKCKKSGHWARDCSENKTEELAAILVTEPAESTKVGLEQTDECKDPKVDMIDLNSKEKSFDEMEICNDDQQCLQAENLDLRTSRNPENLKIDTGIKSYRVPETAGKLRVPKKKRVVTSQRENKIDLKAYIFAIDSGATSHMMNVTDPLSEIVFRSNLINQAEEGRKIASVGFGTLRGRIREEYGQSRRKIDRNIVLKNIMIVPSLCMNIISVSKLCDYNYHVSFENDSCTIKDQFNRTILTAKRSGGIYKLIVYVQDNLMALNMSCDDLELWHQRLGHLNMQVVRKMIPGIIGKEKLECKSCFQGKMARVTFGLSNGRHKELFGLIHSDVCGPFEENAIGGYRYYVTFIDDKSRYTFVYLMRTKSEVFEKFKTFEALIRNKYMKTIKILRSDNGGEYLSTEFDKFLKSKGIEKHLTVAYTPQQNGVAERMNRTIVESARTMMIHANLPKSYWGYAVLNAAYIRNRCISNVLDGKSAFEIVEGRKPDLEKLRVFGCVCYSHVPDEKRKKLDSKAEKCIFLGLSNVSKACIVENVSTKRIFTSRDVKFCEDSFLNQIGNGEEISFPKSDTEKLSIQYPVPIENWIKPRESRVENLQEIETETSVPGVEQDESDYESVVEEFNESQPFGDRDYMGSKYTMVDRNLPPLKDINAPPVSEKRKSYYRNERVMLMDKGPRTYNEAVKSSESDRWLEAMKSEMQSLDKNNVWELVPIPKDRKLVDCRWVLGRKYNSEGKPDRYKARLVAKGFTQEYGLDYEETFAPVVHFNSLRLFLTLAVYFKMNIQQMDVVTAFLYGELEEEIFMEQPPGFEKKKGNLVCRLKKSLYGLKQSPRQWYKLLDQFLRDKSYRRSDVDPCIYVKGDQDLIMIALYVDDLIIASKSEKLMKETKQNLFDRFEMKDLGRLHYCLGIEIVWRNDGTCSFNQSKYIENVLQRFNMNDCKPVSTPINSGTKLTKEMCPKTEEEISEMNAIPYRSAVGSLIYLVTGTRPDIAVAVGEVAKYANNPGKQHWMAVKRIFRYLKETVNLGINCQPNSTELIVYSDADWAGDLDTRRSTTGYLFKFGNVPICWKSKRQPTVALSTAEAEYMALSMAVQTVIWIRKLLKDFNIASEKSTVIYEDNQGCIAMAKNPVNHERTKHIDIRYNFVREKVEDKTVEVKYLETGEMLADILTKGLPREQHRKLCEGIGLYSH